MHKRLCVAAVWLFVLMLKAPDGTFGQSPWKKFVPFKRVEADPTEVVRGDRHQWSLDDRGHGVPRRRGREKQKLVLELRKKHKLEAYTHAQVFDYTQDVRGRGINNTATQR